MSDLARLPKWAQRCIERLERDVEYWRNKACAGPEGSNTFRHEYADNGANSGQPLGSSPTIRFQMAGDREIHARLKADQSLEIMATRGHGLRIAPQAGNVVRVEVEGW